METDELIRKLGKDLKAVQPLRPSALLGRSVGVCVVFVGVLTLISHRRDDLAGMGSNGEFLVRQAMLLVAGLGSLVAFARLALPQGRASRSTALVPAVVFGLLALEMVIRGGRGAPQSAGWPEATLSAVDCTASVGLSGLVLTSLLVLLARRGATVRPTALTLFGMTASIAFASWVVDISCANENPMHLLLFHWAVPALALAALGLIPARSTLKW